MIWNHLSSWRENERQNRFYMLCSFNGTKWINSYVTGSLISRELCHRDQFILNHEGGGHILSAGSLGLLDTEEVPQGFMEGRVSLLSHRRMCGIDSKNELEFVSENKNGWIHESSFFIVVINSSSEFPLWCFCQWLVVHSTDVAILKTSCVELEVSPILNSGHKSQA